MAKHRCQECGTEGENVERAILGTEGPTDVCPPCRKKWVEEQGKPKKYSDRHLNKVYRDAVENPEKLDTPEA